MLCDCGHSLVSEGTSARNRIANSGGGRHGRSQGMPPGRQPRQDWRTAGLAAGLVLCALVVTVGLADPGGAVSWSYQVLTLCLLLAAVFGRALVGTGPSMEQRQPVPWFSRLAVPALVLAALLPHGLALKAGFVSDDFGLALVARQSSGLIDAMRAREAFVAFHRPIPVFLWWAGDRLWSGAPVGYHVVSLLLHAVNSVLVFAVGRRVIGSGYGALAAAALFAVHPLNVEAVTWCAASPDLLCAMFSLLSLLFLELHIRSGTRRGGWFTLVIALCAFVLALLSKELALAMPGIVAARLLIGEDVARRRQTIAVIGSYALILAGYLVWRVRILGGFGGYETPLSFWNTVFPSAPLLVMADFLFPLHRDLVGASAPAVLWWAVVILMGLGALWLLRRLDQAPARVLWLCVAFLFVAAVPTWMSRWHPSTSFEWTRFAYFPAIGLAWLFGAVCAGRGFAWRQSGAAAAAICLVGAALTVWYSLPWVQAGRLASSVLAAGVRRAEEFSTPVGPPTLYVSGLPEAVHGAPVFAYCYPQAVMLACESPIAVHVVSARPQTEAVHPDVMAASVLDRGEYLLSWHAGKAEFEVVRAGRFEPAQLLRGDRP